MKNMKVLSLFCNFIKWKKLARITSQHLKLILKGYLFYNEGSLIKFNTRVIQNYKIL